MVLFIMNWWKPITAMPLPKAKNTPLPFNETTPFEVNPPNPKFNRGLYRIDKDLSQDHADAINDRHPEMKYLDHGLYGVAYETPDGNVVKITSDRSEANAAALLIKNSCPCIAKVFDVHEMKTEPPKNPKSYSESKGTNTWEIVIEKLEPLSGKEKEWINYISKVFLRSGTLPTSKEIVEFLAEEGFYDEHLKPGVSVFKLPTKILYEFLPYYKKYKAMIDCLRKYNFLPGDAHEENIGNKKDGSYAVLDLGGLV